MNHSIPADGIAIKFQPKTVDQGIQRSAPLSMANTIKDTIKSRKVAILAADVVNDAALNAMKNALLAEGATVEIVSLLLGTIKSKSGAAIKVDKNFLTTASVLYDAVYIPGGADSVAALINEPDAIEFVNQTFKHCKAIAAEDEVMELINKTYIVDKNNYLFSV